jgi:hypothetical protein
MTNKKIYLKSIIYSEQKGKLKKKRKPMEYF